MQIDGESCGVKKVESDDIAKKVCRREKTDIDISKSLHLCLVETMQEEPVLKYSKMGVPV